jgi:uncharacterized integral membrane protein
MSGDVSWLASHSIPLPVILIAFGIAAIGIVIGALYSFVPAVREFMRSIRW